jgi:flavin-dependent dehydrogenase
MSKVIKQDVVIAGGGLAGLTLAYQLKNSTPELDILVLEKNQFPVPEKTAKVGESTVEIGSRYLNHTLGLKQHFSERHLRKHGLRCFFGTPEPDFSQQDELGVSQLFGIPTYQIDRGAIENYLHTAVIAQGSQVWDGVSIDDLTISDNAKSVSVKAVDGSTKTKVESKWLIDAAGRQALIKRSLDLSQGNDHFGNAVWFRVDRQIKIDDWTANSEWTKRIKQEKTRWLSTNHLMGPGYWVWIIPLDNGATSIGIVMDDTAFSSHDFSNVGSAMVWLAEHHPHCADALQGAEVLDYVAIRDYSHSCKQMFSEQGWGMTGESGVFADPFYSPGSDFIAFNNTFLHDLITRSHHGEDIRFTSRLYQNINQSFFNSTLSLYTGQYGGFGDRRMMSLKLVWDYAYYWGVLSLLFFKGAITDVALLREINPLLNMVQQTNAQVQSQFRERAKLRAVLPTCGVFLDQYQIPCLRHFNRVLEDESISVRDALGENVKLLEEIASYICDMLSVNPSTEIATGERALLGDYRHGVLA